jgi:hypothetical protein
MLIRKSDKWILESKGDFRSRMSAREPALAHSPDEADAAVLCCLAAQLRYGFAPGQKRQLPKEIDVDEFFAQKIASLHRQGMTAGQSLREVQAEKRAPLIRANFGTDISQAISVRPKILRH